MFEIRFLLNSKWRVAIKSKMIKFSCRLADYAKIWHDNALWVLVIEAETNDWRDGWPRVAMQR